jgi:hypothetical protein
MEENTTDNSEDQESRKNSSSEKACDEHVKYDVEHVCLLQNSLQTKLSIVSSAVCSLQAPNKVLQLCMERLRKCEKSSKSLSDSLATSKTKLDSLLADEGKITSEQEIMASQLNSVTKS